MELSQAKHVYFVGIGGIGISAIARMMMHAGARVSGSDRDGSKVTRELEEAGAQIFIGHDPKHIADDVDMVVYTIAIPADSPELAEARTRGIPVLSYPEALGQVSRDRFTIAVAGTHGKTTTTAMIAKVLVDAGLDPTVIVGSLLVDQKSNFIAGASSILVVEACEYRRSFLHINPDVVVVTNIDEDHLDYYRDLDDIKSAFKEFVAKLAPEGHVIANLCQQNVDGVFDETLATVHDYSEFSVETDLAIPGAHNYENAKAALAVAHILHVDTDKALTSLANFQGTWRRFQKKGTFAVEGADATLVIDDYAHHPSEIKATLAAARQAYPDRAIIAVFQPHMYSRTKALFGEFTHAFADADDVVVAPIYAAREAFDADISHTMVANALFEHGVRAQAVGDNQTAKEAAQALAKAHATGTKASVVLILGAGDITHVADALVG